MAKIKPTLNSADLDILTGYFDRFRKWAEDTFATKQELKDTEERLSHEIGQYKADIIDDYRRVDENQVALQGRVFDHEARIEKLEKQAPSIA